MSGSQNAGSNFGLSTGVDASIFGTNQLPDVLGLVRERLQQAASNPDLLSQVFGDKANTSELQSVIKQWAIGDFSQLPSVQILSADITKGAFGLYAHDTQTVYLSDTLFQSNAAPTNSLFGAVGVLVEETFHWLDDRVGNDTAGDEGELARNLVFGANLSSNELARIRSENDSGIIVLNGQSLSVEQNDTLSTADNLGTLNSVCLIKSGWVGSYWDGSRMKAVPNDYYRFYVNNTTQLDLTLYNLGSDVDLYLLNSNGSTITSSRRSGTSNENISSRLDAGSYYIQVRQYGGNSNYSLGINSIVAPYDYAGNSTGVARNIGTLGTSNSNYGGDWLGWADNNDYYRFSLNGTRDLRLSLTGLSADADVQVLNSSGTVIGSSALGGNNSESINLNNLGAGTYYARVYQYSGNTYYNLSLRAENRIDQYMATVRQIYLDVLNREPDSGGQQGWANAMLSGSTYAQVRAGIANSQESRNNINNAYQNVLLRNADAGGLQGYVNALANNSTLRQVYESIATSNEARNNFWTAQYYNNTERNGSVVFAQSFGRTNTGFDRNWGYGSPSGWVSSDNFSARIFGQVSFAAGLQEIRVGADDGVRVRVNGQTVIDRLVDQAFTTNTAVFNAGNGGNFNVEIEYYERGGAAVLNFSTRSITPPDYAGNSTSAARNIGTLNSVRTLSDWVGSADTDDYYRFNISGRSNFSLNLTGLSADADVRLLDSAGAVITSSAAGGTSNESINTVLGTGTYFVRVYPWSGANTNYNLSLNATRIDYFSPVTIDNSGWQSVLNARNADFRANFPLPWYAAPGEVITESSIRALANSWLLSGNDDAGELLHNYLLENNNGNNYNIDFDEAIRESSGYRNNILNGMVNTAWSTISSLVRSDYYSGQVNSNWITPNGNDWGNNNWKWAIGGHHLRYSAYYQYSPGTDIVTVGFNFLLKDVYDFASFDTSAPDLIDFAPHALHLSGAARAFEVSGQSSTYQWQFRLSSGAVVRNGFA
jgi:hypothetical protein